MAWWKAWIEQEGVTVKSSSHFNPDPDAETLYKAMKGIGTNEQAIIDVLTKRSNAQPQQIAKSFKAVWQGKGKDLTETLKSELCGKFERLIVALMYLPYRYEAKELHDAIKGSRDDVSSFVDPGLALQDAQVRLRPAGKKIRGTDEMKFITILCTCSATHLLRVFEEYEKIANKSIEDSIKSETHGSLEEAMLTVGKVRQDFDGCCLAQGAGTRDGTLIRNIVSRSEIDLNLIKCHFKKMYGKTLSSMIMEDTSGDYKNTLLSLVGSDP
uniref:Annexin n=2 Tax=Rhinopithecus TaxID=542827 RepID=A0A2K6M2D5_RHIBE